MGYRTPKISTKKLHISFFLTTTTLTDSMGFFFGNVANAQSTNPGDPAACTNCNNSEGALGTTGTSTANEMAASAFEAGNVNQGGDTGGSPDTGPGGSPDTGPGGDPGGDVACGCGC